MNPQYKKPMIIAIICFGVVFLILTVIAIVSTENNATSQREAAGTEKVDPVSGEKIIENSHLHHTDAGLANADEPVMLGFGKLADYGMAVEQRAKVDEQLTAFAKSQEPKITQMSFYKDSYRQQLPDENGVAHMTFMIQANKKNDYFVDVTYSGTSDAKVFVYQSDKKTLLFAQ